MYGKLTLTYFYLSRTSIPTVSGGNNLHFRKAL
jgi:hypothetical protein